ncbi:DUF3817 domain-containing protein [Nocardioides sp. KR10-350]|uniref:DUF3817 domain-containing protein n=1 Tax=Nocardioides cheoyonin TaxID=3156615 RepID=UPI0032B38D08
MKAALNCYKVIATIVGCLLIVLVVIGVPLEFLSAEGSGAKDAGNFITEYVGIAHGYLYMIYLVTTFVLSRKARWDVPFTIVTLICGTIPFASFWAELRAIRHTEAEHPELVSA